MNLKSPCGNSHEGDFISAHNSRGDPGWMVYITCLPLMALETVISSA